MAALFAAGATAPSNKVGYVEEAREEEEDADSQDLGGIEEAQSQREGQAQLLGV